MGQTKTFDFGSDYDPTTIDRVVSIIAGMKLSLEVLRFEPALVLSEAFIAGVAYARNGNMTEEKIAELRERNPEIFDAVEQAERECKKEETPMLMGEA